MKRLIPIIAFLIISLSAFTQPLQPIDANYYSAPMKIPFFLAGNFAELRPNHFHGGIDIKTQGRTGIPVYAAAEGSVSRISISPTGYGNALYLDHPNGTTTVYGHLERFVPKIEDYIRKIQYEKETFTIDQVVPVGTLTFKKGEQIAFSGNAGASGGPHLHFEIRRTKEEILLNPLLFHMPVNDKTKPIIQALMVYPISDDAGVSGKQQPLRIPTVLAGGAYKLKNNLPIPVWGKIGFGLQAFDLLDGNPNKCGVYSIKLSVDDKLIYSFAMDDVVLEENKYINSHMDYALAIRTGQRLYRTWLQPGNKLSIYDVVEKKGIYQATDKKPHHVRYEVTDAYGNATSLAFTIQSSEVKFKPLERVGEQFKYNRNNHIRNDDIEFNLPEGALYDDVDFRYARQAGNPKFYSPVYTLHNGSVPLHFACPLRIKAVNLPQNLESKVMLAQVDPTSGRVYSATGKFTEGWVEGNIRVLGNYALVVDTVAPKIIPLSIANKKTLQESTKLRFTITDNLSGIETFRGTIDDHWVLFEYDLKNNLITYTFDKGRMQFGKNHVLNLEVTDFKGNNSTYKANFYK
ncbi:MAG TPA: M23 family peptidase [Prolixibacteraceae bacterium]|nr:M23 family peptidase [Prolixibacteraceae bacterium]